MPKKSINAKEGNKEKRRKKLGFFILVPLSKALVLGGNTHYNTPVMIYFV